MSDEKLRMLQAALDLKQKELDLIDAIDRIRDTALEPMVMLSSIVNVLADRLGAEFCLLSLLEQETGDIELKAISDRGKEHAHLEQIISHELLKRVVELDKITIWEGRDVLPPESLTDLPPNLHLVATPIIIGNNERLGALLLARSEIPFDANDIRLLSTAEDYLDSAVIQAYAHSELQQRIKELETIYRIDRIRDRNFPFDEMLDIVIKELQTTVGAEMGFVMLYDLRGRQLEMRAATHKDLLRMTPYYQIVDQLANESLERGKLICRNNVEEEGHSVMCLPLLLNEQIIGVLGVLNHDSSGHFSRADRRLLNAIGSQMDTAIFESMEIGRLRQVLGRSVDPHIMDRLLARPDVDFLKGERMVLTVLYTDIRGSTHLAEQTDPELLVGFLNHYLTQMTDIILSYEGTLDKFIGDGVMALFGAPFSQEDHALRAVRTGLALQPAHQTVVEIWRERGIEAMPIGVGIATGELIVGEMGSAQRSDYTVIGRAANLGARICGAAKGGQVLISQATYDMIKDSVEAVPITGQKFKGLDHRMTVYDVKRILD
jgi:class 3 adenylate cyclase/GTP-sensing pleiotropic transcriptional regulator CodY